MNSAFDTFSRDEYTSPEEARNSLTLVKPVTHFAREPTAQAVPSVHLDRDSQAIDERTLVMTACDVLFPSDVAHLHLVVQGLPALGGITWEAGVTW